MEVQKKALPLQPHLRNGCLRRTGVLEKTEQRWFELRIELRKIFEKSFKKVCRIKKKPYLCKPDSKPGLTPENDPRLDPRTQATR